jgi:nitrite reductase (NO-forming)
MARIEIASASDEPRALGRPLMSDHNLSARLWATAAVLVVPFLDTFGVGWWLPVHLAMLGAASQAIVGGQLMFSTTLGLTRGPARSQTLTQLAILNVGAALVIAGRLWSSTATLGVGAAAFVVAICWVTWQVHTYWRRSVNRRFAITGTFYRLAGLSIILGASIGGALGIGAFDAESYLEHKTLHMALNVLGWAGMTIVGTAVTLLPTILHVRAPSVARLRPVPWLMFGGLLVLATGASLALDALAAIGLALYVAGLAMFAVYMRQMLATPRRRRIPTAAFHLIAALTWAAITSVGLVVALAQGDAALTRDLLVVGGGGGFVFQALLGAWSFLLPSTRPPEPKRRRNELTAMELGGPLQIAAYNIGLVATLFGLLTDNPFSLAGIALAWSAAAWTLTKAWSFPALASLPRVQARAERWWAPPET